MKRTMICALLLALRCLLQRPVMAAAQTKVIPGEMTTVTATVEAIDMRPAR